MRLSTVPNIVRNTNRFAEIAQVAAKYGLADWLTSLDTNFMKDWLTSGTGVRLTDVSREERVRLALTELGPTFIKLGQMLSTRADLVGPAMAEELRALQTHIPPDSYEQISETIQTELGAPIDEIFDDFEFEPIGSASIGQVHAARLKDGADVVVKIQHQNIQSLIETDLDILEGLAELAEQRSDELALYQPQNVVHAFRRNVLEQLDFLREKHNLEQFRRNFADDEVIYFPEPCEDWCTRRVLTMERLFGLTLEELQSGVAPELDRVLIARRGANAYLQMIFHDGFYHADPHPGNFVVMDDEVVGFLDCGLVGRIDARLRGEFEDMLISVIHNDTDSLVSDILQIGSTPRDLDRDRFGMDVAEFVDEFGTQNLAQFDMSGALNRLTAIIRDHRIVLPANVSILLRVLIMLEGTGRYIEPNFSLLEVMEPYEAEVANRRYSPARIAAKFRRRYRELDRLLDTLPSDITDIVARLREGRFDVKLEHLRADATVNRVVYGILTAALYLGSSQLWAAETPPTIYGVSVFGALGCAAAVILGGRLIHAIHKSGDLVQKRHDTRR